MKLTKAFVVEDRGVMGEAWYRVGQPDALVKVTRDGKLIREFLYPAYKIWNLAAHWGDIVESELSEFEKDDRGFRIAGSTGFGGCVMPSTIDTSNTKGDDSR